jgi:hypothetical protein
VTKEEIIGGDPKGYIKSDLSGQPYTFLFIKGVLTHAHQAKDVND